MRCERCCFCNWLPYLPAQAPAEYQGRFLNYKQLKKQIKYTDMHDPDSRTNFLLAVQDELQRVNRCVLLQLLQGPKRQFSCTPQGLWGSG